MKIALAGKRALILGAPGRLREAIAEALRTNGATVLLSAADLRDAPPLPGGERAVSLDEPTASLGKQGEGPQVSPAKSGAPSPHPSPRRGEGGASAGALWLLVNVSTGAESGPVPESNSDDELETFASAARTLGAKRIINVISAAGVVPVRGAAAFSAGQAGLASLSRVLAMELGPDVLVNALAVGALAGEPVVAERFLSHSPLKRAGTLAEIVSAALFLADPMNSYTTGHVTTVDGGWSIGYARNF